MFRRQYRGAAYHRRQHRTLLAVSALGLPVIVAAIAADDPGVVSVGILWTGAFAWAGLSRHSQAEYDEMDRRAGIDPENKHR